MNLQRSPEGERYKRLLPGLFKELGYKTGPAGLMTRAQSGSGVAVKIFVKQNQIAPIRIVLKFFNGPIERSPPVFIPQENVRQRTRNFRAHFP